LLYFWFGDPLKVEQHNQTSNDGKTLKKSFHPPCVTFGIPKANLETQSVTNVYWYTSTSSQMVKTVGQVKNRKQARSSKQSTNTSVQVSIACLQPAGK
jgi:hypothetical protein